MQSRPGDQFDWALLRGGGADLMLNTLYESDSRSPALDPARKEIHGDLGLYFHCANLDAAYEYLRSKRSGGGEAHRAELWNAPVDGSRSGWILALFSASGRTFMTISFRMFRTRYARCRCAQHRRGSC
jgi:hypothetical protein